jgi:hypothetical protein
MRLMTMVNDGQHEGSRNNDMVGRGSGNRCLIFLVVVTEDIGLL